MRAVDASLPLGKNDLESYCYISTISGLSQCEIVVQTPIHGYTCYIFLLTLNFELNYFITLKSIFILSLLYQNLTANCTACKRDKREKI